MFVNVIMLSDFLCQFKKLVIILLVIFKFCYTQLSLLFTIHNFCTELNKSASISALHVMDNFGGLPV